MLSSISELEKARGLALRPHGWQYSTGLSFNTKINSIKDGRENAGGDGPHDFQQISDKVCEWFVSWQPWQQRQLLCGITNRCATPQLEYLATTLEPVLHRDFITTLKKRYPTAPFKEMKRRLEAKAKAKALKSFEANIRPRSTLSLMSEGPLRSKNTENENVKITRSASLVAYPSSTYPELLIPLQEPEDFDTNLMDFADNFCDVIMSEALKQVVSISGEGRTISSILKGKVGSNNATFDVLGNVTFDPEIVTEENYKDVKESENAEHVMDAYDVDVFGNLMVPGNDKETKSKVTFSDEHQHVFKELDASPYGAGLDHDYKGIQSVLEKTSLDRHSQLNRDYGDKFNSAITSPFVKPLPKLHQTRMKMRARPSLVITKPLVHQSLPNTLAKHHTTVHKRVELLKAYPASRASSVALSHRHHSARTERLYHSDQFFADVSDKFGPVQMELRTGMVNKPVDLSDVLIPIQRMYKNTRWWNQAMQPNKKYVRPVLTDLLSQYKAHIAQIWRWIAGWHDHEKMTVLVNVIKLCDSEQISYLTQCLADRLQARLDFGWLPDHILLKVFSSLPPEDLESCSKVCRRWKYLTSTDDLWMIKCHEFGLKQGIPNITRMVRLSRQSQHSIDWRAAYEELKLITEDAQSTLRIPRDVAESMAGVSSVQDDRVSSTHLEGRASVLTLGLSVDGSLSKVSERKDLRSSIQGSMMSSSGVPTPNEGRIKLGGLTKYLLKLKALGDVAKENAEDSESVDKDADTESANNSDEDALDSFESLRSELLQSLPQRPSEPRKTEDLAEEDVTLSRSRTQTAMTVDFSKFGRSTLESRIDKMRRLRKKNGGDEEESAIDVRPELFQARDLKTITDVSNGPTKMFIIPNRDARLRLEKQAAFVKSVKQVRKLQAHMDSVLCLKMDIRRLISGSMDRTIRIWDIRSGRSVHKLYGHKGGVCCLDFDNEVMVSGSWDSSVQVWDIVQFERKALLLGHTSTVSAVKKGTDFVLSASHDGTVRVWCLRTYKCLCVHQVHKLHILCMAVDDQCVITGSSDKTMKLTDLASGKCLKVFVGHSDPPQRILLSGNLILTGTVRGQVYFWSKDTRRLESVIQAHEGPIFSISLHNGHFYTSSGDMTIKEWALATMSCVRILEGHKGPVNDFKVSERHMVSCSADGQIRVWDMILPPERYGEVVAEKIPIKVVNRHTGNYSKEKSKA